MITDLILSLILFGLSIACFVGLVAAFIATIKESEYPIVFVVGNLIALLCIALSFTFAKYGNPSCSASAKILCLMFGFAGLASGLIATFSGQENGVAFALATIFAFLFLLGGIKFFPDFRIKNPDCDFQQTQQNNGTLEHKSSEEKSLPSELSEQVKQSSNKDILILDKENKNIYKLDENISKQILELLDKQEQ